MYLHLPHKKCPLIRTFSFFSCLLSQVDLLLHLALQVTSVFSPCKATLITDKVHMVTSASEYKLTKNRKQTKHLLTRVNVNYFMREEEHNDECLFHLILAFIRSLVAPLNHSLDNSQHTPCVCVSLSIFFIVSSCFSVNSLAI